LATFLSIWHKLVILLRDGNRVMFGIFSKKKNLNKVAHNLFDHVIKQSRQVDFYTKLFVEDSLDGRFDLMAIHMAIILDKLNQHKNNEDTMEISRNLQEVMFDNLDLSLREIGVGDLGVGKKIKVMAEAFYGRIKTYHELFQTADKVIMSEALKRNLYREKGVDKIVLQKTTTYVFDQLNHVKGLPIEIIFTDKVIFNPNI
jgi:cytochrome b pre-mRNA-processing protein 3